MLVDEFLPAYDISDSVATVVHANTESTWGALMEVDMLEVGRSKPLIGLLTTMRMLPDVASHILHGERSPAMPDRMRLRDIAEIPFEQGGWVLLGERPADELALGLVGKFWRPVIEYAAVPPERFRISQSPATQNTSTPSLSAASTMLEPCCGAKCGWRRPTSMPGAGFGATGRSASARERTCS
jgi:hypothetical protein